MVFKAIVLDFDGVILESVDIKTRAFRTLFKDFPEHLDEITEYHLKNGGLSRYRKIEHIYRNILKIPLDRKKLDELGDSFSKIVVGKMVECPYVEGALEFLEEYSKKVSFFVASGTPEDELKSITDKRGISKYFKGVYGTPSLKSEILVRILKEHGFRKNEVLFVGDSVNDYEGAVAAGVVFIGRVPDQNPSNPLLRHDAPHVNNLKELKELLESGKL